MACGLQKLELCFRKGSTIRIPLRLESDKKIWKQISNITKTAPVGLTVLGHSCPDAWRALVTSVEGMRQINATSVSDSQLRRVTAIDSDTIEFNDIDASRFSDYVVGTGYLMYYEPVDLSVYFDARMNVRSRVGAPLLLSLTVANGGLEIDTLSNTFWINMSASDSELIEFKKGVFDIELINNDLSVRAVCSPDSVLTIVQEVTTE